MKSIYEEIEAEIIRAEKKHGSQIELPSLNPFLINRGYQRMCEELEIPTEDRAKHLCESAFEGDEQSHSVIVLEEFSEAVCCMKDEKLMRGELVQLAAMVVNWIKSIDHRTK